MSLRSKSINSILICMIFAIFTVGNVFALDKIIAIVNDELITRSDLSEYIKSTYAGVLARGRFAPEELEKIRLNLDINGLNNLIEDKLILSEAKGKDLQVNGKLVDERIDEIRAQYPDEQTFLDALVDRGVTLTDIRNKILDQLMIQFIISNEVRSKIFVNPHEVTKYYDGHIDDYMKNERLELDSIFISFKENKEQAQEKSNEALEKIDAGEKFLDVLKEYSESSSIGTVERGQLMPEIEEKIFNLKKNEVSPLIEVDSGIYIFKVKKILPPETASIEEVKDKIYNMLFSKKFEKHFNTWIEKLKENAYIEIK